MSEIVFTELRQFNSGAQFIYAVTKYNGLIFFSIDDGNVWTYNPITGRFLLNSTFTGGDSVRDFVIDPSDNTLYAVTGGTDGKLYSYDNDGTWTELADTSESIVYAIKIYEGNFYMGTQGGTVHKWDGASLTISLTAAETTSDPVFALFVHDNLLFAGTQTAAPGPRVFVFDNSSWSLEDTLIDSGVASILCFEEFNSELYAGTTGTSATGTHVWKRDGDVSPVVWVAVRTFTGQVAAQTMEVFFDKLYVGTANEDTIQRFDGGNWATIKDSEADLNEYENNASYADGEDCLYFGGSGQSTIAHLFAMCPRCSDQVLISGASPFGWNIGDCDITPEICKVEDGCFCEILELGDCVKIQIKYNGSGTPRFIVQDLNGTEVSNEPFVNIVGIIYEIEHCFDNQFLGEHQFIIGAFVLGASWTALTDQGASDLTNIIVISEDIFCTTVGQFVTRSSDGGLTWGTVADNGGLIFVSIAYDRTNDIAVAVTSGNDVWVSLNLGETWVQKTDITTTGVNKVTVAGGVIFGSGGGGTVSKSSDNGDNWTAVNTGSPRNMNCIFAFDNQTVWAGASGPGDEIRKTTNGGSGWVSQVVPAGNQAFNDIFFFSASNGIAGRNSGAVAYTIDGGSTWIAGASGIGTNINGVWMESISDGYFSADGGNLKITDDGGATWADEPDALGAIDLNDIDGISDSNGVLIVVCADVGESESFDARISSIASSPCIDIRVENDCGLLIKYTNDDNFADFNYENGLVNQIRIKAHFWKIKTPQEKTIHVTSSEEVIPTRQVVKKQIMLETDIMPEYMHEKLAVIFSHAAIEIEGITYVAEEGYEYEFGSRYRQTKGKVLLTDKTYTKENIF